MWEMDRVAGYCFIPLFPESWGHRRGWGRGGARQVKHNHNNIPIITRIIRTILSNILHITLKTFLRVRRRRELSCLEKLSFLLARKKAAVQVHLGCPGTFGLSRYFWDVQVLLGCPGIFGEYLYSTCNTKKESVEAKSISVSNSCLVRRLGLTLQNIELFPRNI